MYKKIGILSILLVFALVMTTVALPLVPQGKTVVPANSSRLGQGGSPTLPIVTPIPDGNYSISIQNNKATKVLYTPLPKPVPIPRPNNNLLTRQIQPESPQITQPIVLYDSQHPDSNANVEKINWHKIIQVIILILQGINGVV